MPLNGSDVASKPANTTAVPETTIQSTPFNAVIDDIYSILNTVRSVAKGFTGASTPEGARDNLEVDKNVVYSSKSSNYTAVGDDNNAFHRFTASATLSLTAAATLGSAWHYTVFANGGDVTVDPDGTETINGATTLRVPDGTYALIMCSGTAFYAFVLPVSIHGECKLSLSGGNLLLSRFGGKLLTINGAAENIPSVGITLSPSGLTPSTLYYIYAYMNSGTMTIEASTTTHATDSSTGVEIMSGDATRTLVGMARPVTGPAWVDSNAQRLVRSWFNRAQISGSKAFTANRSTSSTSYVELNTEIRTEFLVWSGENVRSAVMGACSITSGTASIIYTSVGFDGTTNEGDSVVSGNNAVTFGTGYSRTKTGLSEGYHYATVLGKVASQTGQWGASSVYPELQINITH